MGQFKLNIPGLCGLNVGKRVGRHGTIFSLNYNILQYKCLKRPLFSKDLVVYSRPVENALKNGKPVVALESAIITHGMPYPDNLK